jgi:hypothetical protein
MALSLTHYGAWGHIIWCLDGTGLALRCTRFPTQHRFLRTVVAIHSNTT